MNSKLLILNPKRRAGEALRKEWFPYYAGFSPEFANAVLSSARIGPNKVVLDPWNGAGTTTAVAHRLGQECAGLDLNPVMVIVAKARLLSPTVKSSLYPLARDILRKADEGALGATREDSLHLWFRGAAVDRIRLIERAVYRLLVSAERNDVISGIAVDLLSSLASFFYTALFRMVRRFVAKHKTSNPTWIKIPESLDRAPICSRDIDTNFIDQVRWMSQALEDKVLAESSPQSASTISLGSSSALPLKNHSIDFVLSSPPYCTRIDYAVATRPELAALGYDNNSFNRLRRNLIGTTTVERTVPTVSDEWGPTCVALLKAVQTHRSRASASYYFKSHVQYFAGLFASIQELRRVLKPEGRCALVVQDSYYKEIHNDLPRILLEMSGNVGFHPVGRVDFSIESSWVRVHPGVQRYRTSLKSTESVCLLAAPNG